MCLGTILYSAFSNSLEYINIYQCIKASRICYVLNKLFYEPVPYIPLITRVRILFFFFLILIFSLKCLARMNNPCLS